MGFVVRLVGFRPGARDDRAWTLGRIEESAQASGPWYALETQPLDPVDLDPTQPAYRNFTTTQATLVQGFYRVVFVDDLGNEQAADPVFSSDTAVPPSVADLREASPLLAERFPSPEGDVRLAALLRDAIALVETMTCRKMDSSVPVALEPLALMAIRMKVESLAVSGGDATAREGAIGDSRLRSFSAGPYSESYFGPGDASAAGKLDPDPVLADALWGLATEECREEWLRTWARISGRGNPAPEPYAEVVSFDWAPEMRF